MKLLLDANISWRLTEKLSAEFGECQHVDKIGITIPAKDIEIWRYAKVNDCVIVTNDEDFLNYINIMGFPPKIVLLKTGNQSNQFLEQLLVKHKDEIINLAISDELGLIEIY